MAPLSGLTALVTLHLANNAIADAGPLSGLTKLAWLDLYDNTISDLSPLSGLTGLTTLHLFANEITDVTPISGLTGLTTLYLSTNEITDVLPLAGLSNLSTLYLSINEITNVSPLSSLVNLTTLDLGSNDITDVKPLSGLAHLRRLVLDSNCLTSIGGLAGNTGLGDGDYVSLEWNALDAQALGKDVTALRDRGVTVVISEAPSVVVGAPRGLSATPAAGEVALTWAAPLNSVKPVAYEVRWRSATGTFTDWAVVPCSAKGRHKLTGLVNGTTYTVEVRAGGNAGNGVATATATPASP